MILHWLTEDEGRTPTTFVSSLAEDAVPFKKADPFFLALREVLPSGAYIAGGYVLGLMSGAPSYDVDVWFRDRETFKLGVAAVETLLKTPPWETLFVNRRKSQIGGVQLTVSGADRKPLPISLDGRYFFENASHLIDYFDFTVTQVALDGNTLWSGPTTLEDIREKRLIVHRRKMRYIDYRTKKYLEKGFKLTPQAEDILAVDSPHTMQRVRADMYRAHAAGKL